MIHYTPTAGKDINCGNRVKWRHKKKEGGFIMVALKKSGGQRNNWKHELLVS